MNIPRIVISGTASGVGKTSITSAIIYGLKKRGYTVQTFKVGPDYIDPSYLATVSDNLPRNLDVWLMGKDELIRSFVNNSKSDISIIEGVMGFYDGFAGDSNLASTHHVATILKAPVILVLDASKSARSIGATALGFTKFHKNSRISGFILNKIGSKKHEDLCRRALEKFKIPILGCIKKSSQLNLKSRHLGLIPTQEQKNLNRKILKISKILSDSIDVDTIIQISKTAPKMKKLTQKKVKKPKTTIAIALDNSFNFYYNDNIDALKREGATIKYFSPVHDSKIPHCDGLYIGGGFPEVLGPSLEKNLPMRNAIKKFAENNMPIYAECGGLMYLTNSIEYDQKRYKMVGLFDAETKMTTKMKLNYTKGNVVSDCLISSRSNKIQGHEFHYSEITSLPKDSRFAFNLSIGDGISNKKDGLLHYDTLAMYGHLYFDSSNHAKVFVNECIKSSRI